MTVEIFPGANDPQSIYVLLRQFHWEPSPRPIEQPYDIWTNPNFDSNILVPVDPHKADFDQLLDRAYKALVYQHGADFERAAELLEVQRRSSLDATRWSKESFLDTGMIQWNIGQKLHEVAHDALAASAKASQRPRRYYGNFSPYIARKLLDATLMGQSELGSYVVTAYIPANARFFFSENSEAAQASKLIDVESRSGAEIVDKLEEIVALTRGKLDEFRTDPRTTIFEEIVPVGFSYEMAMALAELSNRGDGSVRFSRAGSRDSLVQFAYEYSFGATESLVLEQVGESLRLTAEPEPVNLVGEVTLLEHVANIGEYTVRLHVANQPRLRTVRMTLSPEQYEVAIEAHRSDVPLRVSGIIQKQGNYNWLVEPTRIRMISDHSNDDDAIDDDYAEEIPDDQDPLF
ncbi:hypothetical protein [Mycobacterium sp. Root135]|uniref:hypothetical protein n=1 Tax=Mycobacterium sp. Root135 TaxID=1736457 RepID=UPI000B2458B6|nr:hypothetical protein [Mycobacterium sp. Root135]